MNTRQEDQRGMYDARDRRRVGVVERHFQSAVSVILLAIVGWFGSTVVDARDRLVKLESQVPTVVDALRDIRSDLKVVVREQFESRRDITPYVERLNELSRRIEQLERGKR